MIRTPKEWDETCRECRGTGTIHRREHFALWTPEEWSKLSPESKARALDPSKHRGCGGVPTDAVICWAGAGSTIFEACKEGVTLARAYGKPVAFEFNEAVAVCRADDDPTEIAKRWWKLAYGKTYEQSMRDR